MTDALVRPAMGPAKSTTKQTTSLSATDCGPARPYHHGDLSRALLDAALRVLDRDGVDGLSLRAVAREAGVSPAAPYHHFKDKNELFGAVAAHGFEQMMLNLKDQVELIPDPHARLTALGVGYVCFARENPALYRVMWDASRTEGAMPEKAHHAEEGAFGLVKQTIIDAGASSADDPLDLEVSAIAAWCGAHGLAEMAGFPQFAPLVEVFGGERPFYTAVMSHMLRTAQVKG